MVDLMLDLDFKHRFAQVFTTLYRDLVQSREGHQDTNELGDFTCQIFTRQAFNGLFKGSFNGFKWPLGRGCHSFSFVLSFHLRMSTGKCQDVTLELVREKDLLKTLRRPEVGKLTLQR